MTAYDYDKQQWVTGIEGATLRRLQLKEELAILRSEGGARYLRFTGRQVSVSEAIAGCEAALSEVGGAL